MKATTILLSKPLKCLVVDDSRVIQAIIRRAMFILRKPFDDAELAAAVVSSVKDFAKHVPAPPATGQKNGVEPVTEPAFYRQLQATLGYIPFRLIAHDPMRLDKLPPNSLLGLYIGTGHKGVYAAKPSAWSAVPLAKTHALQDKIDQTQYRLKSASQADSELREEISEVKGTKQSVADGLVQRTVELLTRITQLEGAFQRNQTEKNFIEERFCRWTLETIHARPGLRPRPVPEAGRSGGIRYSAA